MQMFETTFLNDDILFSSLWPFGTCQDSHHMRFLTKEETLFQAHEKASQSSAACAILRCGMKWKLHSLPIILAWMLPSSSSEFFLDLFRSDYINFKCRFLVYLSQVRYALEKKNRRDIVKMAAMKPGEDEEEGQQQGVRDRWNQSMTQQLIPQVDPSSPSRIPPLNLFPTS